LLIFVLPPPLSLPTTTTAHCHHCPSPPLPTTTTAQVLGSCSSSSFPRRCRYPPPPLPRYSGALMSVLAEGGWIGLISRGLTTRLVADSLSSIIFTVLWRWLIDKQSPSSSSRRTRTKSNSSGSRLSPPMTRFDSGAGGAGRTNSGMGRKPRKLSKPSDSGQEEDWTLMA
jgi:hypothetical protein